MEIQMNHSKGGILNLAPCLFRGLGGRSRCYSRRNVNTLNSLKIQFICNYSFNNLVPVRVSKKKIFPPVFITGGERPTGNSSSHCGR